MSKKVHILQAATSLFARKGYNNISMAELAKTTGVAQGTIFYHFNNKETLFLQILEQFANELAETFKAYEQVNSPGNGLEALLKNVEFYFSVAGKMDEQFLLLHRHDAYEIADVSADCRKLLERIYSNIVGFFEKAIRTGQKDGSIVCHSARKTAMIIFTMVDGLVRFNTYSIYEAGALYDDLVSSIQSIVANNAS